MIAKTANEFQLLSKPVSAKLLEQIADAVPAVVALYNINSGEYIYVNRAISRLLGYTPDEFINGGLEFVTSLVHPEDLDNLMDRNQQALDEANANPERVNELIATFEYRMRHKNGSWRWLRTDGTVFARSPEGQVELILNVSLDITDRKDAQAQLKRSLQLLETLLPSS